MHVARACERLVKLTKKFFIFFRFLTLTPNRDLARDVMRDHARL